MRLFWITIITVALVTCVFLLFSTVNVLDPQHAGKVYNKLECVRRQKAVYLGVRSYMEDHGRIPNDLQSLVDAKYVRSEDTFCPGDFGKTPQPFQYNPGAIGVSSETLLSDNAGSHTQRHLLSVSRFRVVTKGNGETAVVP
jgi:hypothetical protein